MDQGNPSKAAAQFEEALKIEPGSKESLRLLASLFVTQNKPDAAIQRIDQQIRLAPNQAPLYELLGRAYIDQKNYAKAEDSFGKALSLDKNSSSTYLALGQLYIMTNMTDKAIGTFENMLKVDSKAAEAHLFLARMSQSKQDLAGAQLHYREALKIDPQSAVAANNLAWLLADSGQQLDEALKLAQIAKDKLPNNPAVTDVMGWVYYKKGAFGTAVDLFKESVHKDQKNAVYQYHLGIAYFKSGDRYNAKSSLTQAINLDPKFPGADDARNLLGTLVQKP